MSRCLIGVGSECRKIVRVPREALGGTKHVLAICPADAEVAKAAESGRATLLRFSSDAEVRWTLVYCVARQRIVTWSSVARLGRLCRGLRTDGVIV